MSNDQFDSLQNCHHLISNSLGAMPRGAADALAEYAEVWRTRGVRAWGEVWCEPPAPLSGKVDLLLATAMPGMPFNQTFTVPTRLTLRTTDDGIRMFATPIKELEQLRKPNPVTVENTELTAEAAEVSLEVEEELEGRVLQVWPEYEDCAALAERHGVSLWEVQQAALEAYRTT